MSTKWTGAARTGLIANARVAPALSVAHAYLSFIGQPKAVAANASPLTGLALVGLEMCYVPVDNIRSILICRSKVTRLALRPCRRWRAALVQIRPPARNHSANAVHTICDDCALKKKPSMARPHRSASRELRGYI